MAEYIDRGTAIAKLTALEVTEPNATMTSAKRMLADIPAADVVPVVRCKDCKYNRGSKKCLNPDSFFAVPKDDDFCSYGERKEGAE